MQTIPDLDLLILGSGVAGLSAAVRAAASPRLEGLRIGVLSKAELSQSATRWAQGGVAAVLSDDEDSADLHLADTLAAGVGLCDADAVRVLVEEGPGRVHELIALGAVFDTDERGGLQLAREGGHSMARVVHAGGAATGLEIERALVSAVHRTAAAVLEGWYALDFLVTGGQCRGVIALAPDGTRVEVRATETILATGGAGQLFAVTTNPVQSTGDGLAMALRGGVLVADVEFMQFHPTALHHPAMPRPLLSEALRGHGALLRDAEGKRFVDELSPRDVVSKAMTARMLEQGVDHLWLDATGLESFEVRFPTIAASVRDIGLNPATDWLPVAPAAHYLSGGVLTDLDGASSMPGLWVCGEAACTGVHGANRLASNSLLEGMVFGPRIIEAIERGKRGPEATGAMRPVIVAGPLEGVIWATPLQVALSWPAPTDETGGDLAERRDERQGAMTGTGADLPKLRDELQRAMTAGAGVLRSADSLAQTDAALRALAEQAGGQDAAWSELANLLVCARALVAAATARRESRGAHNRSDYPVTEAEFCHRLLLEAST